MLAMNVANIRECFSDIYCHNDFAENKTIEIINASFIADEESIFGKVNRKYAKTEIEWYQSQSRNIHDIPGKIPKIWMEIADHQGNINSNYGWCIFSNENKNQFSNAIACLTRDKNSRQSQMIYTRPSMHKDASRNGMKDFMCTSTTQLIIRKDMLHYIVHMRSSDAVFGYKNDRFWHDYVHTLAHDLLFQFYPKLKIGKIYWNAGSLHVYPRHYKLVERYIDAKS